MRYLDSLVNITHRARHVQGVDHRLTEIYLLGNTKALAMDFMRSLPCVKRVIRVQEAYRVLGRHGQEDFPHQFEYNGVTFDQKSLHVFAGLCAVDTPVARRAHDEGPTREWAGMHPHGGVQASYKPILLPRAW